MDYRNDRISEAELQREVVKFRNKATLRAQLWTKQSLLDDFEKIRQKDHSAGMQGLANGAISLLDYTLNKSTVVTSLFQKAQDFISETLKDKAIDASTEMILQPKKISGLEADQEIITKIGSTVTMSVITMLSGAAFPPTLAAGALFSIVIYLYKRDLEVQKRSDEKLANELWESWVRTREKSQKKLDTKHVHKVEQTLMSNYSADKQDASKVKGGVNVTYGDCALLLDEIGIVGPNVFDAALAFKKHKIHPSEVNSLAPETKETIAKFLRKRYEGRMNKQKQFEQDVKEDAEIQKSLLDTEVSGGGVNSPKTFEPIHTQKPGSHGKGAKASK